MPVPAKLEGPAGGAGEQPGAHLGEPLALTLVEQAIVDPGGGGNDTILDGSGEDRVFGEAGNDILGAGTDRDTYSGGTGQDRVSYATRSAGVIAGIGSAGGGESGENDTLDEDLEDLNGGRGQDRLIGDVGANTLTGGPGADRIEGGDGPDRLRGGEAGDPQLDGGAGNDTIEGNSGTDVLSDGTGADLLLGGDGDSDAHTLSLDGEPDYANCGPGANDKVDFEPSPEPGDRANPNCEIR